MGPGGPHGPLRICALTTVGRRPSRGRLPGRSRRNARSCWPRRRWNRSRDNRPGTGQAARARRDLSPGRPEARPLTSTENTPPATEATALEHAETGAPAPEELEQQVEELGGAPVATDSPLFSDFDVHPDIVAALGVGLGIALFQALTSVQEMTLTFVPKVGLMLAVFWVTMSFMTTLLSGFFTDQILPLVGGG